MFKIQIWQFIENRFVDAPQFGKFDNEEIAWQRIMQEVAETGKDRSRFQTVAV